MWDDSGSGSVKKYCDWQYSCTTQSTQNRVDGILIQEGGEQQPLTHEDVPPPAAHFVAMDPGFRYDYTSNKSWPQLLWAISNKTPMLRNAAMRRLTKTYQIIYVRLCVG